MTNAIVWEARSASANFQTAFADFKTWRQYMTARGLDETKYQLNERVYNDLLQYGGNIYLKYSNLNRNRMECYFVWKKTIEYLELVKPLYEKSLAELMQQISVNKAYAPSGDDSDPMNGTDPKVNTTTYLYNTTKTESNPSFASALLLLKGFYFDGFEREEFLIKNFFLKVMTRVQPRGSYAN